MSATGTCSCGSGCGCSQCAPASVALQGNCTDPTVIAQGRHLSVLDAQFCLRRLQNGSGYLVARQTGSGTWVLGFTTEPVVPLSSFQAVTGQVFGDLLVQGSDNIMRTLLGPASAGLVMMTNAAGQLVFAALPPATVLDPLTVTTLTVTGTATIAAMILTGTINFTGLATGTITQTIGLNASNDLIIGSAATTGVQSCMFYEQATSPGVAPWPNQSVTAGNDLTIGNLLSDSVLPAVPGGALITPTNAQTLTVLTAGWYDMWWCGQVEGSNGSPSINLLINGVNVNSGNAVLQAGLVITTGRSANLSGFEGRRLAAGNTIRLQLGAQSGASIATYAVRFMAQRTGP